MEACYEYLGCDKQECIMHGQKGNNNCWEVDGTLCNHEGIEIVRSKHGGQKENACARSNCIYYKAAMVR